MNNVFGITALETSQYMKQSTVDDFMLYWSLFEFLTVCGIRLEI